MPCPTSPPTIGVLASGGVDSCVLTAHLLRQGYYVCPFYVRCGLAWERDELSALRAFLKAVATSQLEELRVFDLPLADLYGDHWSIAGRDVPDAESPDEAVYLPGRNALLCIKPVLWCGMHGIGRLALATLAGNPFSDASDDFFHRFEAALAQATGNHVSIQRPFAALRKADVVLLGEKLPLKLTFSCIAPDTGLHCGRCNKCAERQAAFVEAALDDPTEYAITPVTMKGEEMTKPE
jgi:7-cyano-7-deazaguanine synthase